MRGEELEAEIEEEEEQQVKHLQSDDLRASIRSSCRRPQVKKHPEPASKTSSDHTSHMCVSSPLCVFLISM